MNILYNSNTKQELLKHCYCSLSLCPSPPHGTNQSRCGPLVQRGCLCAYHRTSHIPIADGGSLYRVVSLPAGEVWAHSSASVHNHGWHGPEPGHYSSYECGKLGTDFLATLFFRYGKPASFLARDTKCLKG
jgi:hypothetical protein